MYSGTTLTKLSGRLLGAHQKIDRVARRHLELVLPDSTFPKIHTILHFEGKNGPDAIKRKSPAKDEPWHYLQPYDESDVQLIELLTSHYQELVLALREKNNVRAGFEAAWIAHGIVDGLTPAHHYPYEEKLQELRSGQDMSTRTSIKDKIVIPGEKPLHQAKNNWKMWGPKGLLTTHFAFEGGVATLIAPLKLRQGVPVKADITALHRDGLADWFRTQAKQVADMEIYDNFYKSGWTTTLARQVRSELAPTLVRVVATVWCAAAQEAIQSGATPA